MAEQQGQERTCADCEAVETDPWAKQCGNCGGTLPAVQRPAVAQTAPMAPVAPTVTAEGLEIDDEPWGDADIFAALSNQPGAPASVNPPANPMPPLPPTATPAAPSATSPPAAPTSATPTQPAPAGPSSAARQLRLSSPELVITVEPGAGVLLGRDPASPISTHPAVGNHVSSRHARVWIDGDPATLFVSDIGSTNGTWLAGIRLLQGVQNVLRPGDTIQLTGEHPVIVEVL